MTRRRIGCVWFFGAAAAAPALGQNWLERQLEKQRESIRQQLPAPLRQDASPPREVGAYERFDEDADHWVAEIPGMTPVEQKDKQRWCWAACAEMIHARYGTRLEDGQPITQEVVAERITGTGEPNSPGARAASAYEIMWALNPDLPYAVPDRLREGALAALMSGQTEWELDWRRFAESHVQRATVNIDMVVRSLRDGHPAVVGLLPAKPTGSDDPHAPTQEVGHAYVVYGARYVKKGSAGWRQWLNAVDPENRWLYDRVVSDEYDVRSVLLLNPMHGGREEMEAAEFLERIGFMYTRDEAREILLKELELLSQKGPGQ